MRHSITPEQLAERALRHLKAAADSSVATQAKVYFKPDEDIWVYGVATPATRQIANDLYLTVRDQWQLDHAVAFCEILIKEREIEAKTVGMFVLANFKRSFDKTVLKDAERWLADNHCADWSTTDALSMSVLKLLIQQFPELVSKIKGWTGKRNLWLRRASAVAMVHSARHGEHLDDVYLITESLLKYPEDLIQKANGWLLREAGRADPKRLEVFLLKHGPHIPRTTLRYAIERFSPTKRSKLMAKTRAN